MGNKVKLETAEVLGEQKEELVEITPELEQKEEPVETTPESEAQAAKPVTGVVVNCSSLNVRAEAIIGANVVSVIYSGQDVVIDKDQSTDEWLHITEPASGFCVRKYIALKY